MLGFFRHRHKKYINVLLFPIFTGEFIYIDRKKEKVTDFKPAIKGVFINYEGKERKGIKGKETGRKEKDLESFR